MAIEQTDNKGRIPEGLRQWLRDGRPPGARYRYEPGGKAVLEWSLAEMEERHKQIAAKHGLPLRGALTVEAARARLRVLAARHMLPR